MPLVQNSAFKLLNLLYGILLITGLYSCGNSTKNLNITEIKTINTQRKDVTVYIQGKIEKVAPLIKQTAYQINDSTGKIWVITHQTNLKIGDQVVLKGQVQYQSIPIANQEYGEIYLEEK
ncbi:hypothetical protein H6F32_06015 [Anabaena sp. FACHB-1237]|uniref:hypothetical protein n=1 Tax=Anabaena sp. FACHB-1237 TaxID=2692769 RepID=UPI0016806F0B|nr:hypothetical protein [Anabaena sp. FACHB-1237]MBD2137148.1 hypothetical protein [Anabaena sp. FACHB-1237]